MPLINVHEAKTHLSRLLNRVLAGEEIVIARAGKPVARLVPAEPLRRRWMLGTEQGRAWISEDFQEPMSDEALDEFTR